MRRLAQELRNTGHMFAANPSMIFVAVLVAGLAISTAVQSCCKSDRVLSGSLRASRVMRVARVNTIWRGTSVDRGLLRTLAYPRPPKKAKAPEKSSTPLAIPRTAPASGNAPAQSNCASLSDLRFPEFNLLIPPL